MGTFTDNNVFYVPAGGETGWDDEKNADWNDLEIRVELRDADANRSNYTPHADALFRATDTGNLYLGDGTNWNLVALGVDTVTVADTATVQDSGTNPAADGEVTRNGSDVKVHSGGAVRNLSNVGSGGSGVDIENTDGTTLLSSANPLQAGTDLDWTDDGDGSATLDYTGTGGGDAWSQTTVSSDYTASDNDSVWIDGSANTVTVTLPSPTANLHVRALAIDAAYTVKVAPNGTESINGSTLSRNLSEGESETYETDGTNWWVV